MGRLRALRRRRPWEVTTGGRTPVRALEPNRVDSALGPSRLTDVADVLRFVHIAIGRVIELERCSRWRSSTPPAGGRMKVKRIDGAKEHKTYAVVFDTGDEVAAGLAAFAKEHHLGASHFTAIGALRDVVLGYFDWETKDYRRIPLREQVEVLSLAGDIVLDGGQPKVHAHVVIGKRDGTAHGGHLIEAHVRPTLEVMVVESPRHLQRQIDRESGLALIAIEEEAPG